MLTPYLKKKDKRDLSLVMNDQDNDFIHDKLTNLDSIMLNRNPLLHEEAVNKKKLKIH